MAYMDLGLEIGVLLSSAAGKTYNTKDQAAMSALDATYQRSVTERWEYNGVITKGKDGRFHISIAKIARESTGGKMDPPPDDCVGIYHTHPPECVGHEVDPADFSNKDRIAADGEIGNFPDFQSYIETPNDVRRYTPAPNRPMKGRDEIIRGYSIYNP